MSMDRTNSQEKPKPGPGLVKAWFGTVINPLLSALHVEQQYLERRNWSWNHWRGKLESILPVADLIGRSMEPNLQQFYEFHPDIRTLADEHDKRVQQLWEQCAALQNILQTDEDMRQLYRKATSPEVIEMLKRSGQRVDIAEPEEEGLAVYAEYVINSREMLSSHYTTSGVWNTWRDQFLALQQKPSIDPYYKMALGVGEELGDKVRSLMSRLGERRSELSIEHDVPIVSLNEAA